MKPKWVFRITDHFQIGFGLDLFFGKSSQLGVSSVDPNTGNVVVPEQSAQFIGNFHDNDRVFFEFKYSF